MERFLSKSRVLLGFCAVLLIAALNRQDPMVYAMFLFLAMVSFWGLMLPWLSLRLTTLQLVPNTQKALMEGDDYTLDFVIKRKLPWPAFMVTVETEWQWASKRILLSQTVAMIRAGQVSNTSQMIRFPCRGRYELVAVRLSSGFPLGLTSAHQTLLNPQIQLTVLPAEQTVQWPLPWLVAEDSMANLTTRRVGQSFELGTLRSYQYGESVGRVNWRASARAGNLVIQHFQQSGSVRLRVGVELPYGDSLGDATGPGEQTVRLAAGICQAAVVHEARLFLHLQDQTEPVRGSSDALRSLSVALGTKDGLFTVIAQIATVAQAGEQIALVVSATCPASALLPALDVLAPLQCQILVCIALGRVHSTSHIDQGNGLRKSLMESGFHTLMDAP